MPVINIKFGSWQQSFIQKSGRHKNTFNLDDSKHTIIKDDKPSLVITLPEQQQILKFVRARHWIEFIKLLWCRDRINKEIKGNYLLAKIGLTVPAIIESGLGLIPVKNYNFIGYYIMEDLSSKGYYRAKEILLSNRLSREQRRLFLDNVLHDIRTMYLNRIVFNDLKLGNIFCTESGAVAWIDTGVSHYSLCQQTKLEQKFRIAINRFLNRHRSLLTTEEVSSILQYFNFSGEA